MNMGSGVALSEADLIFPDAHTSIHKTLGELKRGNLCIKNRLKSIYQDATFVRTVKLYGLPLIANERCGSWYIDPVDKHGSAYFKSTDGHFGEWSFSLRRLNLHLLPLIGESGGCCIIDSTRRGKSMPDALSKTIPIWLTVLNRLLFPDLPAFHELCTPPEVVSASEHAQIASRLVLFEELLAGLDLDIAILRLRLRRPMIPHWITPNSQQPPSLNPGANSILLCTASSRASAKLADDAAYVQGAADDQESWACGLSPEVFWKHATALLATDEDQLPSMIGLLMSSTGNGSSRKLSLVVPTQQIFVSDLASVSQCIQTGDTVVACSSVSHVAIEKAVARFKASCITLDCGLGKLGSRALRHELVKLDNLPGVLQHNGRVLCCCPNGRDLSIGVALAIVCRFVNPNGVIEGRIHVPSKDEIKRRLAWITLSIPDAAPSRATLQSVNAYLMS